MGVALASPLRVSRRRIVAPLNWTARAAATTDGLDGLHQTGQGNRHRARRNQRARGFGVVHSSATSYRL